jgi:MerR family copper efflux transcriptional regulator
MLIRELAQRTGVSTKTIRYYESVGLLPRPQRGSNRYRLYTEADVELLCFIVGARSLGYPLTEIARFLAARDNGSLPCQQVLTSLETRLHEVERRIADLQVVRATLERIQQAAQARPQPANCDDQCVCHLLIVVSRSRKEPTRENHV